MTTFKKLAILAATSALSVGAITSTLLHKVQLKQEHNLPTVFSEMSQLEDKLRGIDGLLEKPLTVDASYENSPLEPIPGHLVRVYDATANIFQASNVANEGPKESVPENFANHIKRLYENEDDYRHPLFDLVDDLPFSEGAARISLSEVARAQAPLRTLKSHLTSSWTHKEDVHKEWVTTTSTDSDGNETTSSSLEYDYSIHHHTPNKPQGYNAHETLISLGEFNFPLVVELPVATYVKAEGRAALDRTVGADDEEFDANKAVEAVNSWNTDSNYADYSWLRQNYVTLVSQEKPWKNSVDTAKYVRTKISRRNIPGPSGYQFQQGLIGDTQEILLTSQELFNGLNVVRDQAPVLKKILEDVLEGAGDPQENMDAAVSIAKEMYAANFPNAFDANGYDLWVPITGGLGGFALILAAGLGLAAKFGEDDFSNRSSYSRRMT